MDKLIKNKVISHENTLLTSKKKKNLLYNMICIFNYKYNKCNYGKR